MPTRIRNIIVKDIRFPTSQYLDGSDAMNPDPDYSAAYVILETDHPAGIAGHGLTFTIGRGNEICVQAIKSLSHLLLGKTLESFVRDMAGFWRTITRDSQLRWLGPEKGIMQLALGAVINAVWDLYAKVEKKPLWQLIADLTPEKFISLIDFTYISDAITPQEALILLKKNESTKKERIDFLQKKGYPAYTTSAGWLGYSDQKIRKLCREAKQQGWKYLKMKVGSNIDDDLRRAAIIREEIGYDLQLMMDANQVWDVEQAIRYVKQLEKYQPWWIEEPTSPDDILGHKRIADAVRPVKVATGEHCPNRVLFKQFITSGAVDICQIDSCRMAGVNEVLTVLLLAAKYRVPVCPHAGGVGLGEYVQHLSMIDYICISASLENRIIEYVDHLHEHFLYPVTIKNNAYLPPSAPGYSITMKPESLSRYSYPDGEIWKQK
jgi:L-fuconate dehydratase